MPNIYLSSGKEHIIRENPNVVNQILKFSELPYLQVGSGKDWNLFFGGFYTNSQIALDNSYIKITAEEFSFYFNKTAGFPSVKYKELTYSDCKKNVDFPNISGVDESSLIGMNCLLANQSISVGSSVKSSSGFLI